MIKMRGNYSFMEKAFKEKYPRLNAIIAFLILCVFAVVLFLLAKWLIITIIKLFSLFAKYLTGFVSSTDKVVVVAMITGTVSLVGVIISSIVAKSLEYRLENKKYLYDKREKAYSKFVETVFVILEDSKKNESDKIPLSELTKMMNEFSKELTLWGSNRVVRKWLDYRKTAVNGNKEELLWKMEDMIYEIRKDVGLKKKMKKGDILSIFIDDIENLKSIKKEKE